ncbi:MAG: Asp-tRNA(Asn)/Glu-tRNA(Gln) amidotransferase subunit GatB [Acidobacteriota bacterium]|nr:Asp-tRNA(Asn)/Glu-tRNA(Gln) amidotransferase subunit GatB [Acidobacteriota bacterium]MDQ7088751.1 Asp-tRNA(Asn)/Glu-tRNA(Gln) amidotransferase subunit GatB [Acidobacteriota bacterium]
MAAWRAVIGLEVHARLQTRTKLFCPCEAVAGGAPNSRLCPVCLGLPGALPTVNREAVRLGVRLAEALGCTIHRRSVWARKNYFYPDLPKGYQITQYDHPLATGGRVRVDLPRQGPRWIRLERVHLEEDAGRSVHERFGESSCGIDLNRCGVPLVEIVSAPDLETPAQAAAFATRLRAVLMATGVSEAEMEKGSLRCDANVSLSRPGESASVRTEIKNLNSFRHLRRALEAEITRQEEILRGGGRVEPETRGWDDRRRCTVPLRGKEAAAEYRYLREPDLPELVLDPSLRAEAVAAMPEPIHERRDRFVERLGLGTEDAGRLTDDPRLADYFETLVGRGVAPRLAANWLLTEILAHASPARLAPPPVEVADLLRMLEAGRIQAHQAKRALARASTGETDLRSQVDRLAAGGAVGEREVERLCREVLDAHPRLVTRYREGKTSLLAFFIGQVMRSSSGADPRLVGRVMERLLAAM